MHLGQRVEVTRIVGNSPNHFQPLSILFQDARTTSEMSSSRKVLEKLFVAGELEKRYKCIQCHNVLQDPVQSSCGHRFCRLCLEDLFKREPSETKCPDDGEVLKGNEVFRDKCAEKELLALECYCSNKSLGCSWTGLLAHLDDHDAECPFTKVKCLFCKFGCDAVVLRHQLAKHVENDCLFKVVDCPYCQVGFAGVKMREHLEECGKFPVKCPHGCDDSEIPREKLPEHSKSCPRAPIQCDFSYMGCDFQGPKDSLDEHLSSHATEHLTLSNIYIKNVSEKMQNLQLQLSASQEMNQTYEARLTLQNEALALNKQTLSTHQMKLARMDESVDTQRKSNDELRQLVQSMVNSKESKQTGLNSDEVMHRLDFQDERLAVLADEVTRLNTAPRPPSAVREYEPNVRGSDHRFDRLKLSASQEMNQTYEARLTLQNEALALNKQTLSTHQMKLARIDDSVDTQRKSNDELRQLVQTMVNSTESKQAGLNSDEVMHRLDFQDKRLAILPNEVTRLNTAPRPRSAAREYERVSQPNVRGSDHLFIRVQHSQALHKIQQVDQDPKLQILETTSHDGVFLWKIDKFHRRFREAVDGKTISIYSPPFYTSRFGYKLCACAYLNGDGLEAKGKYMSLFVVLMRGEYDGLLAWPFQQKITMRLLDQDRVSHVTESFRPDPNSPSFQRPRLDMNIASGCPTFCSHHLLRSRAYIRNDAIFIKVIVDTTGMLT